MTCANPKTHLPQVFRDSKLPWKPLRDDQAAAPRLNDGWEAHISICSLSIDFEESSLSYPHYTVLVTHTNNPLQYHYAEFKTLLNAVNYAEKSLEKLLELGFQSKGDF